MIRRSSFSSKFRKKSNLKKTEHNLSSIFLYYVRCLLFGTHVVINTCLKCG